MAVTVTTDYTGRTLDLESFKTIQNPIGVVQLSIGITNRPAKMVSGLQKLAQRVMSFLLTELNTVIFDTNFGSTFLTDAFRANGQNLGMLSAMGTFAAAYVEQSIKEDDASGYYPDIPDDEKLDTLFLTNLTVTPDYTTARFEFTLTTAAGSDYEFVIPVNEAIIS